MPSSYAAISYGHTLTATDLDRVRRSLTGHGASIRHEKAVPENRFAVHLFEVDLPDPAGNRKDGTLAALRLALTATPESGVDTAVVPAALRQAQRKLVILDVDSTLIRQEVIELLAARAGTEALVAQVTEAAMRGELDFAASLHARVATLAGLPESVLADVAEEVVLSDGAERLVAQAKAAGHVVAAVSGGFSRILAPLAKRLDLDYALANELDIVDGALTGRVSGAVVDRAAKAAALLRWAAQEGIDPANTVAIGDGANDLDMMAAAGLSVAFNAKPAVRRAADARINLPYLDVALHLAGF
ncbi:MAG: phosphoserine phosphatase SerB [Micrococcaceae bacterium]|jgi:phosphoserine phosphatase|nr:phosphoserine phosphatase SerB [Micrococcaceae bacterium]